MEIISLILRVSLMYAYALILLRLSGKQSIGALGPLDFVVATMLGDLFDNVFWATVPVLQGLVPIATLIALHTFMTYLASRHPRVRKLLDGTLTPVIRQGQLLEQGLRRERTPKEEVFAQLKLQQHLSEDEIDQIQTAAWEPDGQLSVRLFDADQPLKKGDISAESLV